MNFLNNFTNTCVAMSGRVKKLLHLRISTIILLFWGDYPPQERNFFLGSLTLAITIPPLASMSRRPWAPPQTPLRELTALPQNH